MTFAVAHSRGRDLRPSVGWGESLTHYVRCEKAGDEGEGLPLRSAFSTRERALSSSGDIESVNAISIF